MIITPLILTEKLSDSSRAIDVNDRCSIEIISAEVRNGEIHVTKEICDPSAINPLFMISHRGLRIITDGINYVACSVDLIPDYGIVELALPVSAASVKCLIDGFISDNEL